TITISAVNDEETIALSGGPFIEGAEDGEIITATLSTAYLFNQRIEIPIPLFASGRPASEVRSEAARMQRIEDRFLKVLRSPDAHARVQIMTLAQFIEAPMDVLQTIIDEIAGHRGTALKEVPKMPDLTGLPDFLQDLKNQGMHPFLTGDIPVGNARPAKPAPRRKPYVISGK
ncbi:MAG: hypothetical protein R6T97_14085, partial [Yoonia sp.]